MTSRKFSYKSSSSILAILLIGSAVHAATINGCLESLDPTKVCTSCYQRQVTATGCGPRDLNSNCLIHTESAGQASKCTLCKQGYAKTIAGQCVPGVIPGCIMAMQTAADGLYCGVCDSGLYVSYDWKACVPVRKDQIVENCLWIGQACNFSYCKKCSPGYVATQGEFKKCVPAKTPGCLVLGPNGTCAKCDVYSGYSKQEDGTCKYTNF